MRAHKTVIASAMALSFAVPALAQTVTVTPPLTQTFTQVVPPGDAVPVQVPPPEITGQDRTDQLLTEIYALALRSFAFQVQAELNRQPAAVAPADGK